MPTPFGDVPVRPHYHQPRPDLLAGLKAKVLNGAGPVAVTGRAVSVGLEGMGGIGKTTLAADLCREPEVAAAFPGGIFWVTLGETPDVAQAQRRLIHWIGGTPVNPRDTAEGRDRLTALLADQPARCLIILDDLWEVPHARDLLPAIDRHTLLITTRRGDLLRILGAEEHKVGEMTPSAARALLAACARCPEGRLPAPADAIVQECGRLPLALAIVGALLADQDAATWAEVLEALRRADHDGLDSELPDYTRSRHVFGALAISIDRLEAEDRDRFTDLAVFPEDTAIPTAVFDWLWFELPSLKRKRLLSLFIDRNLTRRTDNGRITLHDLQRDYLVKICAKIDLAQRHQRLVDGYRKACDGVWAGCPDDDYGFRWLPWHLREAGETDALRGLLFDPAWMTAKMRATGVATLETDYALLPDDIEVRLVGGALRLSSHVLAEAPDQLTSQLWGRLAPDQGSTIEALLDAAGNEQLATPWLKPRRPSLTPPGGPLLRTLTGHAGEVNAVAVLADGRRVLSGSDDNTLKLWDIDTGTCVATMVGHSSNVNAVAVLTDGRRALSGSGDNTLKLWDLDTGACLATMVGHTHLVNVVAVLADGHRAISGSWDRTLKLWDLDTCTCLATMEGHTGWVSAVAVLADGHRAISGSDDHTLKLWDIDTGTCLRTLKHSDRVNAVALSPNGHHALSSIHDGTLGLWDLNTGACLVTLEDHFEPASAIAMLPDGLRALSGSLEGTLKLWNLKENTCLATLEGHSSSIKAVALLPDGRRALTAADDNTLKLWDLSISGSFLTLEKHSGSVNAVAMLPDGRRAISGSSDNSLKVWNLETGACLATLEGHLEGVNTVSVLPSGSCAISGSRDKTFKRWNIATSARMATVKRHRSEVNTVAVLPDGLHAISGALDGTVKVWNVDTGAHLSTLEGHSGSVNAVAALTDRRCAISGAADGTLKLWDLDNKTCLATLEGHSLGVTSIALLPAKHNALSASGDRTLKLWDLDTGTCLTTLEGHAGWVSAVAVLADGCHALSGSGDKTLKLWNLDTKIGHTLFTAEASIECCAVAGTTVVAGDEVGNLHIFDLIIPPEPTP